MAKHEEVKKYIKIRKAAEHNLKDIDVIDATEGGALIRGTRLMKLSDVVDQYCNNDFELYFLLAILAKW